MGWIVLLILIAGGAVAYRQLVTMEAEIRAEIAAAEQPPDNSHPPADAEADAESVIVNLIRARPGILQTDLYKELPAWSRRQVQKELLSLERSGRITRRKSGNTYQLSTSD